MPAIFLTGATGFIGGHVLNKLIDLNYSNIIALTRKKNESMKNLCFFSEGNIGDAFLINQLVIDADYIIHMAGCKNDKNSFFETNVKGTENIIKACQISSRLKKLIFLSSVGVIGKSEDRVIDENTICNPTNEYEKSKYQAELIVKKFSEKNPGKVVILRPTNVFGENDPEQHLLNLLTKIKKHQFYFVGKSLSRYYLNYLYVKEISELIPSLLTLNLNNDLYILNTPVKLSEFIMKCKQALMDETPVRHLPYWPVKLMATCADFLPMRIKRYSPINSLKFSELTNKKKYSSSLLRNDLNWSPTFKTKDALQNLISYYNHKRLLS